MHTIFYLHALHVELSSSLDKLHRLIQQYGTAEKAWQRLPKKKVHPQKEWDRLTALHTPIQLIDQANPQYPPVLLELPQPPLLLYCIGNTSLLRKNSIAIVGSRKMTPYGKMVVNDIVPAISRLGFVIVSGLALGIDAAAHTATLLHSGNTIAVLGSSIVPDEVLPRTNAVLAQKILSHGGLLISEHPPGSSTYPHFYPERNRIIAGLAHATVIVEAAEKSGSLITARLAMESNRSVLAVPGSIFSPQSVGTNTLIQRGATPWLSCQSLEDELEYLLNLPENNSKNNVVVTPSIAHTPEEILILSLCTEQPQTIDALVEQTSLQPSIILHTVMQLVLSGALQEIDNQHYLVHNN